MNMRLVFAPIIIFAAAVSASAQQVSLRGQVDDMPGQPGRYLVDCTNTELTSSVVTLSSYVGLEVELSGSWTGSSSTPVVDVATMSTVNKLFDISGTGKIDTVATFEVTSSPGDFTVMFAALNYGFLPANRAGVLLLSMSPMLTIGSGIVAPDGTFQVTGKVPNDPALDGVVIYGQAFVAFVAGGATLSNPDCITLHK
jgi:hypothetical protein